ncbi:unnamed protein product [Rotaria socialis]|uniref:G-protein coupled receptors family 1 profile domain-containing protein n=1 Tax=Rotaria socialis TaxID=392032 RepID=A0A817XXV2_9BILA|nr:unnamed protein product [Rotaria socialis]CAF4605400.1 unnamed protein product [Rotaria socialis]
MSDIITQVLRTNIYIQPIYFFLSLVTNTLNMRILCSRALRSSPCTHYFLAYAVFSIIYNGILCPTQFLRGFSINWANNYIGCKTHAYILFLIPFQANLMIILASFDRYCSSLKLSRLGSKIKIRKTRMLIVISTIGSALYMLPMLTTYNWNEIDKKCLLYPNALVRIYIFSQIFLYYIVTPILMTLFGLMTINKIRKRSPDILALKTFMRGRRTQRQLTKMLFLQIIIHLILVLPFGITYTMNSFRSSTNTPSIIALRLAFVTWQQSDYFISFFLYILSGHVYRRELLRIFGFNETRYKSSRVFVGNQKTINRTVQAIIVIAQTTKAIVDGLPEKHK